MADAKEYVCLIQVKGLHKKSHKEHAGKIQEKDQELKCPTNFRERSTKRNW